MKKLILATPRGFCAGVDRAIHVVEKALEKFGSPIYVRHEIVHNRYVVETLKSKGVIFVDELDEVPEGSVVIFSAHGVADHIYQDAEAKHLQVVDATCPLVRKVHFSAKRHYSAGRHIILIGHAGHAEVEGTLGQLPEGAITLIRNEADIEKIAFQDDKEIAYITQTTLSVAETRKIIATLKAKFPNIIGPVTSNGLRWICPVGLEKLVPSVKESCQAVGAKRIDISMGADFGMYHIATAIPFTEKEALKTLFNLETTLVAAGGIGGNQGSVVLAVEGEKEDVEACVEFIENEVKGEPDVPGNKGNCEVCRYKRCRYCGMTEEQLPD